MIIMHELGIAEELSSIVVETAKKENLSKVTRVSIIFGQLVQIVPEIFEFAFRETVRNTIASEAELSMEIVPVRLQCKTCGSDLPLEDNRFECSVCSSSDIEIVQGKEMFIKSIEGE